MKKILITGSTGMLGSDMIRNLRNDKQFDLYGLSRSPTPLLSHRQQFLVDLTKPETFQSIPFSPDVIIHTAALTDLNLCERDPQLAYLVNAEATRQLARVCGADTLFVYISTDSVFDGKKGNYSERDRPNPLNVYASTKLAGEEGLIAENKGKSLILRTNIYGFHVPMKNSLAEWAYQEWSRGHKIRGFCDITFNAVFTGQLTEVIKTVISKNIGEKILNVGSSSSISKHEFLCMLSRVLGIADTLLEPAQSANYPSAVQRPADTSLNTFLLSQYCPVPEFKIGVNEWVTNARAVGLIPGNAVINN